MNERTEEKLFRIYLTDIIKYQAEQKTLSVRYVDWINPKPEESRSSEEIIDSIVGKLGKEANA